MITFLSSALKGIYKYDNNIAAMRRYSDISLIWAHLSASWASSYLSEKPFVHHPDEQVSTHESPSWKVNIFVNINIFVKINIFVPHQDEVRDEQGM